jgi:hypothetical protein
VSMYHGYWRDKFNVWMLVGIYGSVAEAQKGLEQHNQQSKPREKFAWVDLELVTQDDSLRVVAVISEKPLTDAELLERYPVTEPPPVERQFIARLNNQQRTEVAFAEGYVTEFNHDTDGHLRLTLIAKLVELLDEYEAIIADTEKSK